MARTYTLKGGTDSVAQAEAGSRSLGFLQPNTLPVYMPGKKSTLRARFLPAFEGGDKSGFIPYRDEILTPDDTGTPGFTNWFVIVSGYRMFGRSKEDFLSPMTLSFSKDSTQFSRADLACPVADCYVKAKESDNPEWKELVSPSEGYASLTWPKQFVLANALVTIDDGGEWKQAVTAVSSTGWEELRKMLAWPSIFGVEPRDKAWPMFLLGDITHPETGILGTGCQRESGQTTPWAFAFTRKDFQPEGVKPMPVDKKALEGRVDLTSSDVLRIEEYQTLVDFLVSDGALPVDLIEQACSHMATVRSPRISGKVVSQPSAPVTSRPEPPAPSPQEGPGESLYWCSADKKLVWQHAVPMSAILAEQAKGRKGMSFMKEDRSGGWQQLEVSPASPPWDLPAPDADDIPMDHAPAPDPAPVAKPAGSAALSQDEEAEYSSLEAAFGEGTLDDKGIQRFIALRTRRIHSKNAA